MNSRALRNQRLRKRAWALVAALLTAADGLAMTVEDVSATQPGATAAADTASTGGEAKAGTRLRIPPPRQYKADEIPSKAQGARPARSKIPPPRRFAIEEPVRQPVEETATVQSQAPNVLPAFQPVESTPDRPSDVPAPTTTFAEAPESKPEAPAVEATSPAPISVRAELMTEPPAAAQPSELQVEQGPTLQVSASAVETAPAPVSSPAAGSESKFAPITTAVAEPPAEERQPDASQEPPAAEAPAQVATPRPAHEPTPIEMPSAVKHALETLSARPVRDPASEVGETLVTDSPEPQSEGTPQALAGPESVATPTAAMPDSESAANPFTPPRNEALSDSQPEAVASEANAANATPPAQEAAKSATQDGQVQQTACSSCGGFHSSLDSPSWNGCTSCGGSPGCVPGQKPCNLPEHNSDSFIGAFCQRLYECLCCPDPCYQPAWVPGANASFFADYARPRTVTRLRYDNLEAMTRPDRNQFWMNQVALQRSNPRRAFFNPEARLQQLSLYQEAAGERGSFFVEYPYRQLNSNWEPTQAGFGDMNFGIKSLLFDCEMLQVSFQMRNYMPTGNFTSNLGNGQFAIDPSILASLKLGPDTYFQTQLGNWIPLGGPGGNSKIAGGIFYWFMSLNQVLWYATPDSPLIATLEMDGWSFENGGYTTHIARGQTKAQGIGQGIASDGGGVSYFNIGPGLRQSICNRVDFGGAITWATNTAHWAQPWFRFEVRFLF